MPPRYYRTRFRRRPRRRFVPRYFNRRRRYRPRGYRRSPAFTAIRNLQRQREVKYVDRTNGPVGLGSVDNYYLHDLTSTIPQGDDPHDRIGRRIHVTSLTMNFTFNNLDVNNLPQPTFRVIAFIWKEGEPPIPATNLFSSNSISQSLTQGYFKDEYRFRKKTILDRKFSMTTDRPSIQKTIRFRIPSRVITTPGDYNDIYFLVLSNGYVDQGSPADYANYSVSLRVSWTDS